MLKMTHAPAPVEVPIPGYQPVSAFWTGATAFQAQRHLGNELKSSVPQSKRDGEPSGGAR